MLLTYITGLSCALLAGIQLHVQYMQVFLYMHQLKSIVRQQSTVEKLHLALCNQSLNMQAICLFGICFSKSLAGLNVP